MKLSEVKGERTLDVLADLIEPVTIIAQDEAFKELMKKKQPPEGVSSRDFFMQRISKALPKLLRTRKAEIIQVLATVKGIDPEKYAESVTLASIFTDVIELLTDEELLAFLPSAVTTSH